jgi:transposase
MSMGHRKAESQGQMFIAISELPATAGHPFYEKLNQALAALTFDQQVEEQCRQFYLQGGRTSIPPGIYFRMLLIGYFEGIDSERGIAWRVADSLSLRRFLGYDLSTPTPDHSSLSRIRQRLDPDTHAAVFRIVLLALQEAGLLKGQTIGVDATTLEANAALRSIVRKDTGQSYQDYLEQLAQHAGLEKPTRSDLAKLDKNRKDKGSNEQWEHPHDPDAKIAKMKDGSTHLAHKAEHTVDLETGALLGVSLHAANQGDTQTVVKSVEAAFDHVSQAIESTGQTLPEKLFEEIVTDKGYHGNACLQTLQEDLGLRTYVSEPDRGRRKWEKHPQAKKAVYANRRRVKGDRGKRLQRLRGERLERSNAHLYETGAMRRTHLRGHENIMKRLIVHAAGFNLGLLLRSIIGIGKPRRLQDFPGLLLSLLLWCCGLLWRLHRLRKRLAVHQAPRAGVGRGKISQVLTTPKCAVFQRAARLQTWTCRSRGCHRASPDGVPHTCHEKLGTSTTWEDS